MLNDPHKNIFYYYRGPSKREEEDIIYDTQIEDNTTKALINCLDNCSDSLLSHFLKYFNINFKYKNKPQYFLQVSRVKSRPDAQIKIPDNSIFIESKIALPVSKAQLINHKNDLKESDILILITNNESDKKIADELEIKYIKWVELHKCFKTYEPLNKNEKFLIDEFIRYLEVIGLSDFTGFNNDDFDFFINRIDDYKPIVKSKLEKFGSKIHSILNDEIKSRYPDKHIGIISKESSGIWYGIRKDQAKVDIFKRCNFTVEIDAESIYFNVVIRDGKYSDKKPIGIFYKKIEIILMIFKTFSLVYMKVIV